MHTEKKYLKVETHIKQAISRGVYQTGDKIPSIRRLCADLGVAKNTVIRAYQELEAQGLLTGIEKSGYRVSPPLASTVEIEKPAAVDMLSVAKEILTHDESKAWLATGSAHPFTDVPAIRSLYAEIGRQARQQANTPSQYELPPGNETLIKHIVRIAQEEGIDAKPADVAITQGAQQGISLALKALTKPGDIVAVESPCYFGCLLLLESLGLKAIEVPSCTHQGIDPQALERIMKVWPISAIIVTPNFMNPNGSTMPLRRRQQLLEASGDTPIVEDDVFHDLSYGEKRPSLKALDDKDRVIYVNSFSKSLDSRLRLGWILSGRYQAEIENALICDNMGTPGLIQSALAEFLSTGKYRQHIGKMRRYYYSGMRKFHHNLSQALDQHPSLKGRYHLSLPQGSFLSWLSLPTGFDSLTLYHQCKAHRIGLLPGTLFGTRGQFRHCVRFSSSRYTETAQTQLALAKLAELIDRQTRLL